MFENDTQVCAVLRHFKSDSPYFTLENDSWIQELNDEDRKELASNLERFNNYPHDKHLLCKWHYIGRGKRFSVLKDNARAHFVPLFIALKLFKSGHLFMPLCFYSHQKKWGEMALHGEDNYGFGYGLEMGENPYELNEAEVEQFRSFKTTIAPHLKFLDFSCIPYRKPSKAIQTVDMRCLFAAHLFLDSNRQRGNYFILFDWVLAYTNGLESLYLFKSDQKKSEILANRVAVVLGKDDKDENHLHNIVKQFYKIRNAIVHGSLLDEAEDGFVRKNIWSYQDILRKSILAFLDLNQKNPTKKEVVSQIQKAAADPILRKIIRKSLVLLNLAK